MSDSEGKILPNLKITLKDDGTRSQDSFEEGELSDQDEIDDSYEMPKREISAQGNKDDVKNNPSKIYLNKKGFETGLDLLSNDLDKKLKERAERFGIAKQDQRNVTKVEINELYKSLAVDLNIPESSSKFVRLNAVHVRGTDKMYPNDVTDYFRDYGSSHIEWINDSSCNVCWPDEAGAARALLGLSKPCTIKTKQKLFEGNKDAEAGIDSDILDGKQKKEINTKKKTGQIEFIDLASDSNDSTDFLKADSMEVDKSSVISNSEQSGILDEPDIAVPPGYWRIGLSHTKAKSLFLRFATKEDKKVRGAEKNSLFYKKNGNPNYGGLKGLISSSKKRKFKASHTRRMVNELSSNKKSLNEDLLPSGFQARTKTIKMTMYADEEEEALRRREKSKKINNPRSVKSRIGAKYDKIQLGQLGKQISDNEDTTTETLSVTCKIPSNFGNNIWEDQSRQMAEEDEKYSHKNHHYDSSASSDSEETERYYAFRSERAQYDAKMNNLNPILYQDTFKSSRGMPETKADLRSRINKLKMESSLNKHRSPLCRDDSE